MVRTDADTSQPYRAERQAPPRRRAASRSGRQRRQVDPDARGLLVDVRESCRSQRTIPARVSAIPTAYDWFKVVRAVKANCRNASGFLGFFLRDRTRIRVGEVGLCKRSDHTIGVYLHLGDNVWMDDSPQQIISAHMNYGYAVSDHVVALLQSEPHWRRPLHACLTAFAALDPDGQTSEHTRYLIREITAAYPGAAADMCSFFVERGLQSMGIDLTSDGYAVLTTAALDTIHSTTAAQNTATQQSRRVNVNTRRPLRNIVRRPKHDGS